MRLPTLTLWALGSVLRSALPQRTLLLQVAPGPGQFRLWEALTDLSTLPFSEDLHLCRDHQKLHRTQVSPRYWPQSWFLQVSAFHTPHPVYAPPWEECSSGSGKPPTCPCSSSRDSPSRNLSWHFLVVQWLRLCTSTAGGMGSIPSWRAKIPHGKKKLSWLLSPPPW